MNCTVPARRKHLIRPMAMAAAVVTLVAMVGSCARPSATPVDSPTGSAPTATSPLGLADTGNFGSLKGICGPGKPTGGSGRGLTTEAIRLGTMADPGALAAPGLEKEFFDVAEAFTQWCNAAGGINGRKLLLDTFDAKLFDVAPQMINACQNDFMLVGNGNAFDAAGVKPRLACKLGEIPAYSVSPQAVASGLQVQATPNPANQYQVGPFRLLGEQFPSTLKNGIAIAGSTVATVAPQSLRARDALKAIGYKVPILQQREPLVDNFRPYMEQIKLSGATAYTEIAAQDLTPEFQAISNVGLKVDYVVEGTQFYDPKTIAAAKATSFPPTWVYLSHLPFEMASQYPVVQQLESIMKAWNAHPTFNDFVALAFNAWTLWAKSATACGNDLTQACVLSKAASEKTWTAGGFYSPRDTDPANPLQPTCYVLMKVTTGGFVYDKSATRPNSGVYNCDPKNVVALKHAYQ
jgi:ABC-type branched-subunit amino acid transport system substrate-binding protein